MNSNQLSALLWAIRLTSTTADFTPQEQMALAHAERKLSEGQTERLSPEEYRLLGDAALYAGTLLMASFTGIPTQDVAAPVPSMTDLEEAQAYCDERGPREVAVA